MSVRTIIAIVSFCVGMSGVFLGNLFTVMMIGEINRKRQEGNQVSYLGFTLPKILGIFSEYRSLYPNGSVHIYVFAALALMVIGMIGGVVCLWVVG